MKIKLWIIYKSGNGFPEIIAEKLQDYLEDYIDIDVGKANKIDPAFIVEEKLDCLIIGDYISDVTPSLEIQNWLSKYRGISYKENLTIEVISGFYITQSDIKKEPNWLESLQENIKSKIIYPPILALNPLEDKYVLDEALKLVKAYSEDFIKYVLKINLKKKK